MKRKLRLIGLDCAHCAAKIEAAVQALPGVNSASLNFMTGRLTIEADDAAMEEICDKTTAVVHKYEPQVEIARA